MEKSLDGENINEYMRIKFLKSIFCDMYLQELKNLHYLHLMINHVMKVILKVNLAINIIKWL